MVYNVSGCTSTPFFHKWPVPTADVRGGLVSASKTSRGDQTSHEACYGVAAREEVVRRESLIYGNATFNMSIRHVVRRRNRRIPR